MLLPRKKLKRYFPWWSKILIKIVLSRLPFSYQFWGQKIGLFQHGNMSNPEYAWNVFNLHYSRASSYLPDEFVICELGPGDSLATAMIAPCFGAIKIYLVDVDNFATKNILFYNKLADFLISKKLDGFIFTSDFSLNELLKKNNACYLTNGLYSLQDIPDKSVDFVFSHAVLEHIRLENFFKIIKETFRILKVRGIASHKIDLKDHLGGSLNNLRFSKQVWESKLFSSSGFYTNRLRASEIANFIKQTSFEIVFQKENCWEKIPISPHKLHIEFSHLLECDLLTSGIEFVLRK